MALRRVRRLAAHLASPPTPHLGVHSATAAATAAALPQHGQQASYPKRKIFACGAGPGADTPWLRDQIITATGKAEPTVLYMGTPSYDGREGAKGFAEAGLEVSWLNCTDLESLPDAEGIATMIRGADIIQVSGGNTLFAVRRWRNLGVDKVSPRAARRRPAPDRPRPQLLHEAMARGAVLCGGSAGCICWFDGGHSDSLAPGTVHPDHRKELTEEERKDCPLPATRHRQSNQALADVSRRH